MIVITGATGSLGSGVLTQLLKLLPASSLGASVRDPTSDKAQALSSAGIRVRRGDFTDPTTLPHAFEGASHLLIVSVDKIGPDAVDSHKAAIDAAKAARVSKVYYTSHMASKPDSEFAAATDHHATEQYLEQSGLDFVSLRNGFYMESMVHLLGGGQHTGVVVSPPDGQASWTSTRDLAEAAAKILAADFGGKPLLPEGERYPILVNSSTWNFADIAATIGKVQNKEVKRIECSDEDFGKGLMEHGVPESVVPLLLGMFRASQKGEFAKTGTLLAKVLGREPESMEEFWRRTLK